MVGYIRLAEVGWWKTIILHVLRSLTRPYPFGF